MVASCHMLFGHAPGAEVREESDLLIYANAIAHPMLNGVCGARFTAANADARIAETLAFFSARGTAMLWWLGPSCRPLDLPRRLQSAGLRCDPVMPGMAIDLTGPLHGEDPPDLQTEDATNESALAEWARVLGSGFDIPAEVTKAFVSGRRGDTDSTPPMRYFLGRAGGTVVSCAFLTLVSGVAGIYSVATVPGARRRGYGAGVVRAALRSARDEGCHTGVLEASELGAGVYRGIGFVEVCKVGSYVWSPRPSPAHVV
jgi:GNAT superfamily N-acetyltransferase